MRQIILSPEDIERFWSKVAIAGPDDCWLWTASKNSDGYGSFKIQGSTLGAHRVAFLIATGEDPGSLSVCHSCDCPPCQNPSHLWKGTAKDNMQDCASKNRIWPGGNPPHPLGENHPNAALTCAQAMEIRQLCAAGERQTVVAQRFGVSQPLVNAIHRRKAWLHCGATF